MVRDCQGLVIFDGDDTLWFVEHLYDEARLQAAKVAMQAGLDPDAFEHLQREIDVENFGRFGLSAERFPTSCVEAYRALMEEAGREPDQRAERQIVDAATSVFRTSAPLAPDVYETLAALQPHFVLALLTKGDAGVQWNRIQGSGLAALFDSITVVDSKSESDFRRILSDTGAEAHCSWSVGNSLPSDINPALKCGMSAIWIDAHVWDHERREIEPHPGRLVVVDQLPDVQEVLLRTDDMP